MKKHLKIGFVFFLALAFAACSSSDNSGGTADNAAANNGGGAAPAGGVNPIVVTSLLDNVKAPAQSMTLRQALAQAQFGQAIEFDPSLDGGVVQLSIVGEEHTILKGEVMGMRQEPSGPVSYLEGYFDRDYGASALYAQKDVVLDASALPNGITLEWTGGPAKPARVLAVYGNLTMTNVNITGGSSVAVDIAADNPDQPWTLARGGGVAVWGIAKLTDCMIYENSCTGDFDSSRDRGAFGGGVYANIVDMDGCVVSGNSILGGGAAGGGVFSIGGAVISAKTSLISRSSITGNRISALFTYGGGVYSDGGGIGNRKTLRLTNCTIARNLVDPPPGMPGFLLGMGYWRGGGAYMSNGFMEIRGCTIVENQVHGVPRTDSLGKANLAGGVAATIGNAHAVETLTVGHSIIAGNTVHEMGGADYGQDIFTGSLLHFRSMGFNRFGVLDFSQILVPVGVSSWKSLCRKHYPKGGDEDGVDIADVLDLAGGVTLSGTIASAGVDAPNAAVIHYEPMGSALDQLPTEPYFVSEVYVDYRIGLDVEDDFLSIMLARLESHYGLAGFAAAFEADFENFLQTVDSDGDTDGIQPYQDPDGNDILNLGDALFFGPLGTWPKQLFNYPYINFWHRLDDALSAQDIPGMGPELLGDDAWAALFEDGLLEENEGIDMRVRNSATMQISALETDQLGVMRPQGTLGDIGAVELP